MNKGIELRIRYTNLIIEGKTSEAWKVLNEIWNLDKGPKEKREKPKEVIKEIKETLVKIQTSKYLSLRDLEKIKGIGKETVDDLEDIYSTLDNLMEAINSGKRLPLRNDIAKKLNKELK